MPTDCDYLTSIAACYVRGELGLQGDDSDLVEAGRRAGLRMHRFKRSELPRVSKCIGLLKGLHPQRVLDIGSGRGAFLWTMLEQMPQVEVTCVDLLPHRVAAINAVHQGGMARVQAFQEDVTNLPFPDGDYDVACALEVLEHLSEPGLAVKELCRVSRGWLLVSVPSKPDDNPEHIQLFSADDLERLLLDNGAQSVRMHHVLNHRIALARV